MRFLEPANRHIDRVFIHSSATKAKMDIGRKEIDRWHRERGWSGIGYHLVIRRDGSTEIGRDVDTAGAHARGHNTGSIGVVMVGGLSDDGGPEANFTGAQFKTLRRVVDEMIATYPGVTVMGHRNVAPTACPSFDVLRWLKTGEVEP